MNLFLLLHSWYEGFKKSKENILAFTCGDIMLFTYLGIPPELSGFQWKVFTTIILTILGGFGGMIGKEIAIWFKKEVWPAIKKKFKSLWKK